MHLFQNKEIKKQRIMQVSQSYITVVYFYRGQT